MKVYFARFADEYETELVLSGTPPFDYAINEYGDVLVLTEDN